MIIQLPVIRLTGWPLCKKKITPIEEYIFVNSHHITNIKPKSDDYGNLYCEVYFTEDNPEYWYIETNLSVEQISHLINQSRHK